MLLFADGEFTIHRLGKWLRDREAAALSEALDRSGCVLKHSAARVLDKLVAAVPCKHHESPHPGQLQAFL